MDAAALAGLNSFGIFDVEADRLDHFFAGLDAAGWAKPTRCAGWSVQDVLAHLAGAELYNHACLNADLDGSRGMLRAAGIAGGYHEFNEWCVRQPAAEEPGRTVAALGRPVRAGRAELTSQDHFFRTLDPGASGQRVRGVAGGGLRGRHGRPAATGLSARPHAGRRAALPGLRRAGPTGLTAVRPPGCGRAG